jgi:methylmalonyl-CoA carboxyltransferase large subunit
MKPETANSSQVADALEALRQELARLGERVAALEGAVGVNPRAPAAAPAAQPADTRRPAEAEGLSEELVLVISAAIAAFLGKKPHIRQIRLLGSAAWAQQGRATIQASHSLPVKHG